MLVKSTSPSLTSQAESATPQVHLLFNLLPQEQASLADGNTFSVVALSHTQCKAGCFPQEQVDFLAQTQSEAEQAILMSI